MDINIEYGMVGFGRRTKVEIKPLMPTLTPKRPKQAVGGKDNPDSSVKFIVGCGQLIPS